MPECAVKDLTRYLPLIRYLSRKVEIWPGEVYTRQDLVNDAYLALMIALPTFDSSRGTLLNFIITHSVHAMQDSMRYLRHSRSHTHKLAMNDTYDIEDTSYVEDTELPLAVANVLATLSKRSRAVVKGCWMQGKKMRMVAYELGISESTVYNEMVKMKVLLRTLLRSVRYG